MNKTDQVNDYFTELEHPLKTEMQLVREIILSASLKMTEDIKWSAPNFMYKGNMATFNPRAKKFINLTFHTGALLNDKTGLLEGDKKEARVIRFNNLEEIESKKELLETVVINWIKLKDNK